MNIDNLIDLFKVEVLKTRSDLNDFSQGSVLYTIARAVAATATEVYLELAQLKDASLLIDSNLINEDLLVSIDSNLARFKGNLARGYVLASNIGETTITIPINTALTDPSTTLQVITTMGVNVNALSEVQIPVVSATEGASSNIPAGKNLISVDYPKVIFTVGRYRDIDNVVKEGLTGGLDIETTSQYYQRIKERLISLRITQKQVLLDYLRSLDDVKAAHTETLIGGLVVIWVQSEESLATTRLNEINSLIQDYLPVGTYSVVKQLLSIPISLTIQVYATTTFNLDSYIKEIASTYIESLSPSSTLALDAVTNLITSKTGLIVNIISPTVSNIDLANNEKFSVVNVEILNVS